MRIVEETDNCVLCPHTGYSDFSEKDLWLQCNCCKTWFHAHCLRLTASECASFDQYHCAQCVPVHGPSTYKPEPRKSTRERSELNYADLNDGKTADQNIWEKVLRSKQFEEDPFQRLDASQVTYEYMRETGMTWPFVIEKPEGLGYDYPVEVIDVATQSEISGWDMGRWADYYELERRDRIRNVISLEISGTDFAKDIERPKLVRDMDWIDQVWPHEHTPEEYPKVQLYCLMGTRNSYTDFHIDFGGTSVFYHIVSGSKVFYFIEPTPTNLRKYEKWNQSPDQSHVFLGDEVKKCYAVHLKAGNTMIIPTGWIHAVYTPDDALVIGGNFLHGLNIPGQLEIYRIEDTTEVPDKFRFPYFVRIHWYAILHYRDRLKQDINCLSERERAGLMKLVDWLYSDMKKSSSSPRVYLKSLELPIKLKSADELLKSLMRHLRAAAGEKVPGYRKNRDKNGESQSQQKPGKRRRKSSESEESPRKRSVRVQDYERKRMEEKDGKRSITPEAKKETSYASGLNGHAKTPKTPAPLDANGNPVKRGRGRPRKILPQDSQQEQLLPPAAPKMEQKEMDSPISALPQVD
ncbi:hypothetical protein BCR43DRAFT_484016 [Syncephalastrum racemosum]|uniref:JmjC domain-containing histone demethylation protein 1 n=1 Tax=Syncephalastrum racemosum TaxID=13706 RepID=A0A1X2HW60_SYNRA|nr:hypothetical protein BCR43DRAFT_484016 [Syncephalastrum racemosum]